MSADLVIRNGVVVDGSGGPSRRCDVAIEGDHIVDVGEDIGKGRREIDADGLIVTPGFIDPHTHYDGQATWDPWLAPSSHHGVTSVVMGNCGVGFAPVATNFHDELIEMMEGVEDIPGTALHEGLRWDWQSFPEYLDALDRQERTIDVATHVPHAALRAFVMGEHGGDPLAQPTESELAHMSELLAEGLDAGALGVSTSRTERHRTSRGENLGTLRSKEPELQALASVLKAKGRGVFQLVSDSYRTPDDTFAAAEFSLIGDIARTSQRPVSYTVQQDFEAPNRWRDLMELAVTLQAEGLDVKAQVAPRPIGVLLGLQASNNVFTPVRAYAELRHSRSKSESSHFAIPSFVKQILNESRRLDGPRRLRGPRFLRPLRRNVRPRRTGQLRPRCQRLDSARPLDDWASTHASTPTTCNSSTTAVNLSTRRCSTSSMATSTPFAR